ncbi:glycosyltransferase family 4 protein [Mucilaginibacter lappiensis]|uniref:Glycosyltransferase involved in cell wall biosynthesis n=1 Tax=Mucilaginibacter lappiensis TaxID=354630 RepID=A0A841JKF9_9SPHI|nr:glycosyltransferase family 4 protein [Mucilaginibacter lappiensis]MBB6130762.1 glycosyltransferase involved in cell wall biosynthesis [Mucilaginibacter lappiensis]
MKLIYCVHGIYNAGGMERVLANKANYLSEEGYDVSIITTDQRGRPSFFIFSPKIKHYDLGIDYSKNNGKGLLNKVLQYPRKQWKHRRALTSLLLHLKADVVISMFDHDVSFLWKIKDGSKKVSEIHFSRFKRSQYGRSGIWRWLDVWRSKNDFHIAAKYDRFVVLTQEDKSYWGNLSNIMVIPNANSFAPKTKADVLQKKAIAIGRYECQKGFDDLIKTWHKVNMNHPDWVLRIFGEGSLEKGLRQLINDLNLGKVVYLCEPVINLEKEYLNSAMVLMTSHYEGLPMALLEGQACGLPLVAYACKCGPKDIIQQDKNGFLVEERDIATLAQRVMELIDNPNKRIEMGLESVRLAENFSERKVMLQWHELFRSLVSH